MSIVVADLVAKIRQEGVQEAVTQVRAVGAEAKQTAAALEIMAAQYSKLHGGSATDALAMFNRAGVAPTAAAMAQAAAAAEKTAAAVAATVVPTQAAARATEEVSKGWTASESSVVRFGAGVLGVGLGISLVAGAARLVHEVIAGTVGAQLEWERSLVTVHGLYGAIGSSIVAISQAQAAAPGLLGSQQEFAQANLAASYLSRRYGLSQASVTGLTSSAGAASFALGQDEAARRDLQARALAFAEGGGSSLRPYGVEGDPLSIARGVGGVSAAQLQALTPAQLRQAQTLIGSRGLDQFAINSQDAGQPGLLAQQARLEQARAQAQSALEAGLEGAGTSSTTASYQLSRRGLPANPQAVADMGALQKAVSDADAALRANAAELGNHTKAIQDADAELRKLGAETGTAAFRLLGFTGSLEDRFSIARMDVGAQAQAAAAARSIGPNPLIARTPAEMAVTARQTAEQDAYASYVADRARAYTQANSSSIREDLTRQTQTGSSENQAAAQRALDEIQRRYLANTMGGQAQQAGAFAQRAQTEAQSELSNVSIQQDERRLAVAEQLASYRTQALQAEGQLAPLFLQQANLQDRMTVAARDNLATRRELIAAQQAELAVTQVTSAYDYEQQRLVLRAEQSRAIVRQGGAPTEDINSLRQQYRGLELQRAASGVDIQALDAGRQTQVTQQQRTGEQLGRDVVLANLEAQGRALQDQTIPLEQHLRLVQAEEASVQRTLALLDLQDVRQIAAAQHALNSATSLALQASAADRAATDMAAGMNLGATAAERWQAAIEKGTGLLINLSNMGTQQADVNGKIAAGLGGGGIGPSPGQPASTVNHLNVPLNFQLNGQTPDQVKEQVHIAVEDALNRFFTGASTAGPPAPSTVGGNGR